MKFYFFNSYHQSLMGYQLTWISTNETALTWAQSNRCDTQELQSALFNSGAQCMAGRAVGNKDYFLLRKIAVTDPEGRAWYINMAMEAEASESAQFRCLIRHILLDYGTFRKTLAECFYAQQEEQSYRLDTERFWAYVEGASTHMLPADDFYNQENAHAAKLRNALAALNTMTVSELALLVPESTLSYFLNQNAIFRGRRILHNLTAKAFKYLLDKDPALFSLEDEVPCNERRTQHHVADEQQENMKNIAACVGAALAVYGAYKLVDYLFGKEK